MSLKEQVRHGLFRGSVEKKLKNQLGLSFLSKKWRTIKKDLKFMDIQMFEILLIEPGIVTIDQFEHMVNSYIDLEYRSLSISVEPLEYRIGNAKDVFGRLGYDSENNRESEVLFVGS